MLQATDAFTGTIEVYAFEDKLQSYFNGECSIDDLVLHTGLRRDAVLAILEKYNAVRNEENGKDDVHSEASERSTSSSECTESYAKDKNAASVVPKLDMADVRKDAASTDGSATLESAPVEDDVLRPQPSTPQQSSIQEATLQSYQSPREVPDSSVEISDLAKRLGARLFQDASILDQLQNVRREKTFIEQLREIVSSSTAESPVKQLQFIPSTPVARRSVPVTVQCKEIDVQTSIQFGEVAKSQKEMRDTATDLPSLDYLSMSELGGLRQIPDTFVIQEDVSSSAFSSDQSAGQVPYSMISRVRTTIAVNRDGSAQFIPSKTVKVTEMVEDSLPHHYSKEGSFKTPAAQPLTTGANESPRTPRISESPWRPSSRRLRLEEVDISTSQESNSLEVVSVGTPRRAASAPEKPYPAKVEASHRSGAAGDAFAADSPTKDTSYLSHQDEEHTFNQGFTDHQRIAASNQR
ncbi:hypothetical protein OESDEN_04610 [Oesophagostomum dentatum]|uniref:Uncharacterized protein n=1 Tax=Oesophagostomum dentatum TaxID=61180 RepID=A0A0B1TD00_OESDE|nr:hypothetical protein OESDEN_04610 [Oesophagostomum dentatum]